MFKKIILLVVLLNSFWVLSQDFLRAEGKNIVNNQGPVILRSIGTGNWMIQEGYMMQSTSAKVNTHTQYRNKLVEIMGEESTNTFYNTWLANHFTKTDLDSMKAWGFNSIRPALHYKWFTLPIEDEQKNNGVLQNTWLEKGFTILDSLVSWCEQNKMYVILDMHGAPGGQGTDANISDYDPTKPSLWESEDNKLKLIALWKNLANRYKDSEWVGGYDIINEPNWAFDGVSKSGCGCKNNEALWDLQQRITEAIRTEDKNHIVFLSGNCWGNNYEGFDTHSLRESDSNMVITFHKYWNSNTDKAIEKVLNMRENYNMPIWLGESGENSNNWFSDCISLMESHNIGWSWWPVKKSRMNNILKVTTNKDYYALIESWANNNPLNADDTFKAVMQYAENHKIEHCEIAKDVIYAMIDQTLNFNTKPYKEHTINTDILCADYDMGRDGYAYHDTISGNYHVDGGSRTVWNNGNWYRNDGVDIGNDEGTPYVGWTDNDEWLQYTVVIPYSGIYDLEFFYASKEKGAAINIEVNDKIIEENIELPLTQGDTNWQVSSIKNLVFAKGKNTIRLIIDKGGFNLLKFKIVSQ